MECPSELVLRSESVQRPTCLTPHIYKDAEISIVEKYSHKAVSHKAVDM